MQGLGQPLDQPVHGGLLHLDVLARPDGQGHEGPREAGLLINGPLHIAGDQREDPIRMHARQHGLENLAGGDDLIGDESRIVPRHFLLTLVE